MNRVARGSLFVLVAIGVLLPASASAQLVRALDIAISGYFTRYRNAENEENCPIGAGPSVGVEARTSGTMFVAASAQAHFAGPWACKGVAILVPYGDGYADVTADINLLASPSGGIFVGVRGSGSRSNVAIAVGGRALYANWDSRGRGRTFVPWLGVALTLDDLLGPFGVGLEVGAIHAPIAWSVVEEDGDWRTVRRFARWKPMWQLGILLRPW